MTATVLLDPDGTEVLSLFESGVLVAVGLPVRRFCLDALDLVPKVQAMFLKLFVGKLHQQFVRVAASSVELASGSEVVGRFGHVIKDTTSYA